MTHEPTATWSSATVAVRVTTVSSVHVTAVCESVSWTCIVPSDTDAIRPEMPPPPAMPSPGTPGAWVAPAVACAVSPVSDPSDEHPASRKTATAPSVTAGYGCRNVRVM